jgi:hypothetical protein
MQVVDRDLGYNLNDGNGTGKAYLPGDKETDDECVNCTDSSPTHSLCK